MEELNKVDSFKLLMLKQQVISQLNLDYQEQEDSFESSQEIKSYGYKFLKSNRGVEINLHIGESIWLSVYLKKEDYSEDDANDFVEPTFNLEYWLWNNGYLFKKNPFKLTTYSTEFEQQVLGFFSFLGKVFKYKELKKILDGKIWNDGYFDWKDKGSYPVYDS
ncbi:hypothetical protein [uncultured Microscilla sp.]|uniref:hypothetical protein n=1 Tax=uncultured Microscilla sp. TaxID=432653 RepID=UPI00261AA20E|nr:hypothetical protein [uncultured Microscilla sp.]